MPVVAGALVLALVLPGAVRADPPVVRLVSGPMMAPSAAWTFYGSTTTHTAGVAAWTSTPPEISALARGLGANRLSATQFTQNVFDYVRNNVATEFRFGLSKGARGALIDQSGTPFDQAELMVKLLREGGVTAGYQVGTITLTDQQFGIWSGFVKNLNQSSQTYQVDAAAACQFLADGGIPAVVNSLSDCTLVSGNLTSVSLGHIWVQANGNLYDPSYKQQALKNGIDIAAAAGCGTASAPTCGSTVTTAVLSGSTSGTVSGNPSLTNLNESAALSQLNTYAQNVESAVRSTLPTAALDDVVGGSEINTTYQPTVGASLPYTALAQYTWTGDIPDQFRTSFTLMGSTNQLFYADEMAGRRLFVGKTLSGTTPLLIDDTTLYSNYTLSSPVAITVQHPYAASSGAYGQDSASFPIICCSYGYDDGFTIVHQFGEASASTVKYDADRQIAEGAANYKDAATASQLLVQQSTINQILGAITKAPILMQHRFGIIYNNDTYFQQSTKMQRVSYQTAVSVQSSSSDSTARSATFQAAASLWSSLEGSATQQSYDSWEPYSAAPEFVIWNRVQVPLIYVTSANMSALASSGQLSNYSSTALSNLTNYAGLGYNFIIPQNAQVPTNSNGCGLAYCPTYNPDFGFKSDGSSLAYLLAETQKGASDVSFYDPAQAALQSAKETDYSTLKRKYLAVDAATGSFRLTPGPDITTGAGPFPYSLPFQRTYDSGEAVAYSSTGSPYTGGPFGIAPDTDNAARMGGGWVHNYQATARLNNSGMKAMGQDSGLDASAVIAGVFTLKDGLGSPSFNAYAASFFTSYWVSRQFINNEVDIHIGPTTESFERLPSGVFNPPPGKADRLVQTGSRSAAINTGPAGFGGYASTVYNYGPVTFAYTDKEGAVINFDIMEPNTANTILVADPPIFKGNAWTFPNGAKVTFNYSLATCCSPNQAVNFSTYVLTGVSNNLGRTLTLTLSQAPSNNYMPGYSNITGVTDENGRHVSFAWSGSCYGSAQPCAFAVTDLNSGVTTYDYTPAADSPDPSVIDRPPYRLRRWFTPNSSTTPYLTVAYDSAFRVATVTDAISHRSSVYPSALFPTEWWKRSDQVDPIGNLSTSIFDRWNGGLRATDPLGRSTTNAYDGFRRKILTTNPEGDSVATTYDVRSNPLAETHHAKPSSGLADITTSTTYGEGSTVVTCTNVVTCNKPATATDARGAVTNYSWDSATGELTQILKPADTNGARPQTDLTYAQFGSVGSQFWMITQKAEKISSSSSVITAYGYNSANKYVLSTVTADSGGLALRTCFQFDAAGHLIRTYDPRATTCP